MGGRNYSIAKDIALFNLLLKNRTTSGLHSKFFNILVVNRRKVGVDLGHFDVGAAEPFTDFIERDSLLRHRDRDN